MGRASEIQVATFNRSTFFVVQNMVWRDLFSKFASMVVWIRDKPD